MKIASHLSNSAVIAFFNLLFGVAALLSFLYPRFTSVGLVLVRATFIVLVSAAVLAIRDLLRSGTRLRALLALALCVPVLMLYALLAVWEGPLYVAAKGAKTTSFEILGASGLYGFKIYGPDRRLAEWSSDEVGLLWGFESDHSERFAPTKLEFTYGVAPRGFRQILTASPIPTALDSATTYTLRVQPAMGMEEVYSLHAATITAYQPDLSICWGPLPVEARPAATVRVDCATHQPLPMTSRGLERMKAYRDGKIPWF